MLLIYSIVLVAAPIGFLLGIGYFYLLVVEYIFGDYCFAVALPVLLAQCVGNSIFGFLLV